MVFEKGSGKPLHHAIVWQCRRGDAICEKLSDAGYDDEVHHITGLKIDTYFPAPKLQWLLEQRPDIRKAIVRDQALIGTIDAYLVYRLTNGRVFATDHTNASRTLLYDIGARRWSEPLCALFGIPMTALPEVRESADHYGETTLEGALRAPIPICGVMGDSQAALFAQRCFAPGDAKATFGTGSSILLNIGECLHHVGNGMVTTIAWVHHGQPTYALEGIINCTGATIAWLKDQLGLIDDPAATEQLALSVPDNGGVYFVPAFAGMSAPYWSHTARAAIVGLSSHSHKAHVVRAALESIAYQVRDVLDTMATEARIPLHAISADGGIVRNAFLMQFTADITGFTLHASTLPELSGQGAVLSGLLGIGRYSSLREIDDLPHQTQSYTPKMPTEESNALHHAWRTAVGRVL